MLLTHALNIHIVRHVSTDIHTRPNQSIYFDKTHHIHFCHNIFLANNFGFRDAFIWIESIWRFSNNKFLSLPQIEVFWGGLISRTYMHLQINRKIIRISCRLVIWYLGTCGLEFILPVSTRPKAIQFVK